MTNNALISEELEKTLHTAFMGARQKSHEFITTEHLLLALLDNPSAFEVLKACTTRTEALRKQLFDFINENASTIDSTEDTQPSLGFQRVIQRAILHAQSSGNKDVNGANVLVAIFGEKDSHAVYFLHQKGVTRLDVVNFLADGPKKERQIKAAPTSDLEKLEMRLLVEPLPPQGAPPTPPPTPTLFISYSHADTLCLERLLVHLRPLERSKSIVCWSDKKIRIGTKWRNDIKKNLEEASIAILLLSADFLASDFIVNNELPPMLLRAEALGLRILPVILKPCGFSRDPVLSSFQAANDPTSPLLGLTHIEQEALYDIIATEVMSEIKLKRESGG